MKKWMCLFLAAVMLFTSIPLDTAAAEVTAGTVVSLSVTTLPDKVKYLPGEALDLTGLGAEAAYQDGSTKALTAEELTVEAPDLSEPGNKIVTVSYEGQSASFQVHVHNVQTLEAVEPTYMDTGLTEGTVCGDPNCGEVLQEQEVIPVRTAPELAAPEISVTVDDDGVLISWEAVEAAEAYQVYRKNGDGEWALLDTVTGGGYLDSTAESGVTVSYTVRACLQTADGLVCSGSSNEEQVFFVAAALSNVADGISVKWTALDEASYYRVYRRLPGGVWEVICSESSEDSYVDTAVERGVTYQYAVRAYADDVFTDYNYDLEIIRLGQPETTVSNKADGIRVSWNEIEEAESYNVYRRVSGGSWKRLSTETETSYLDTTAESGTTYTYTVRSKNGDTLSSNKNRASIMRLDQPTVTLSNIANGVSVKWTEVDGAESYRIYRKVSGGSWELLDKGVTELSYTDTTAESGVTYYYSVRAFCDGKLSAYHSSVQIIRLDQPKITAANNASGIQTDWNEVTGAESYSVYRRVPKGKWVFLANVTGTTYTDKTAEEDTSYQYGVRAQNGDTLSSINYRVSIQRLAKPDVKVSNVYAGVSVKWTEVDGAETYRVYHKLPGGSWERLKKGLTELSYTDTTAESGVTYQYAVRAYNSTGGSGYVSSSRIMRLLQPEATVSNIPGGVRIKWNEIAEAESYNVYRKIGSGSWKLLSNETDTTYLDTTAESGTSYTYTVLAKNGSTLSSNKYRARILRLDAPTAAVSNGNTGVSVKWDAVEGAESYKVSRKVPDGSWKTIATGITDLKYTDTTAKSGVTYHYIVRAYGDGVYSGYITSEAIEYLARPVVTAKTISTTSVKLTWKAVEGAEEYLLYVKSGDADWEILHTGTGTSYTADDLTFGTSYSFSVRARSSGGRSTRSAAVTGKATYPAPSYSLELEPGEGIRITWKAVDGAGSYRVYRRTEGGSWKGLKTTGSDATSYVDTSGSPGTTYEYAVRAFELAGRKACPASAPPERPSSIPSWIRISP